MYKRICFSFIGFCIAVCIFSCQKYDRERDTVLIDDKILIGELFFEAINQNIVFFEEKIRQQPIDSQKVVYKSEEDMKRFFFKKFNINSVEFDSFIDEKAQITITEYHFDLNVQERFEEVTENMPLELYEDIDKLCSIRSFREFGKNSTQLKVKYANSLHRELVYGIIEIILMAYRVFEGNTGNVYEICQTAGYGGIIGYFSGKEAPLKGMLIGACYCSAEMGIWSRGK